MKACVEFRDQIDRHLDDELSRVELIEFDYHVR
jgi:hypothetical protein